MGKSAICPARSAEYQLAPGGKLLDLGFHPVDGDTLQSEIERGARYLMDGECGFTLAQDANRRGHRCLGA